MFTAERGGLLMMISYKVKRNSLSVNSYRDKVNTIILNDFKSYEGKALMINSIKDKKRHPP